MLSEYDSMNAIPLFPCSAPTTAEAPGGTGTHQRKNGIARGYTVSKKAIIPDRQGLLAEQYLFRRRRISWKKASTKSMLFSA